VHLQLVSSLVHVVVPQQVYLLETYVSQVQRGGLYIDPADDGILDVYPRGELGVSSLNISSGFHWLGWRKLTRLSSFCQFPDRGFCLLSFLNKLHLLHISSCTNQAELKAYGVLELILPSNQQLPSHLLLLHSSIPLTNDLLYILLRSFW